MRRSWYVPEEWCDRLNANSGPVRNELMDRHRKRVEALATEHSMGKNWSRDELETLYENMLRDYRHELETAFEKDMELMAQWVHVGYRDMMALWSRSTSAC